MIVNNDEGSVQANYNLPFRHTPETNAIHTKMPLTIQRNFVQLIKIINLANKNNIVSLYRL